MAEEQKTDGPVATLVLTSLDYVWERLRARCEGLTQEEYLWEPVADCWSVRDIDGVVSIERDDSDPEPAPVTTIAWRLWHIGSDCLGGYTQGGLGPWPLQVRDREWFMDVDQALAAVDTAWAAFRSGLGALGEDRMNSPLGERWGPYADSSWADLVLHAQDELSHHGAEIALLRDLYAAGLPG
jgi:DinB superfamily